MKNLLTKQAARRLGRRMLLESEIQSENPLFLRTQLAGSLSVSLGRTGICFLSSMRRSYLTLRPTRSLALGTLEDLSDCLELPREKGKAGFSSLSRRSRITPKIIAYFLTKKTADSKKFSLILRFW